MDLKRIPGSRFGARWNSWLLLLLIMLVSAHQSVADSSAQSRPTRNYAFDTTISQVVLENYLSRAVQYVGLLDCSPEGASPYFEDDLRMLKNTGAKFVGRAAYAWDLPEDDEAHFENVRRRAAVVHAQDPQIILQACVFEIIGKGGQRADDPASTAPLGVNDIAIPPWVFEAFNLPVVTRNFNYDKMFVAGGTGQDFWSPGYSIPDISLLETRMWFHYRACRYVQSGCEAIHLGQLAMIGDRDRASVHWRDVMDRMRQYAAKHARRHCVLFDAHVPANRLASVVNNGNLLLDYLSFPLRPRETKQPLQAELVKGHLDSLYGRCPGGTHPQGWKGEVIPQLYEFDNCKTGIVAEGGILVWGADESTWFANLKPRARDKFLRYAYDWIWNNSPGGYLQMPGRRPAQFPVNRPRQSLYVMNTKSAACPVGEGQEETVKGIWADERYADVLAPRLQETENVVLPMSDYHISIERQDGRTLEDLKALYDRYGVK